MAVDKNLSEMLSDIAVQASKIQESAAKIEKFSDKLQAQAEEIVALKLQVKMLVRFAIGVISAVLLAVGGAVLKLVLKA